MSSLFVIDFEQRKLICKEELSSTPNTEDAEIIAAIARCVMQQQIVQIISDDHEWRSLPPHLTGAVTLKFGGRELVVTPSSVRQTLKFNGQPYPVVIPLECVLAVLGQKGEVYWSATPTAD